MRSEIKLDVKKLSVKKLIKAMKLKEYKQNFARNLN